MKKLVIVPSNMKGRSSKALAKTLSSHLGYRVFRVPLHRVRKRRAVVLSKGVAKDAQLEYFNQAGIPCPESTTDIEIARKWISDGSTVMCRTLLRASEGRGIVVATTPDELVRAGLYTKYFPKKQEYRVHVFNGKVIDIQQKLKRRGFLGERDTKIRNLANGYVFCRDNIDPPEGINELAVKATKALGYMIGGVDIAYNVKKEKLMVLEVNANPGMQGTTLERYADGIINAL